MTPSAAVALVIVLALFAMAVIAFARVVRKLRHAAVDYAAARLTRAQHSAFVLRLRDLVFQDPFRFMNMLCSKESEWFVRKLWDEVGDACARIRLPAGTQGIKGFTTGEQSDPHPIRLPPDGLAVQRLRMTDGNVLAIVTLPPPRQSGETYLIGVVLPPDESLKQNIARARKLVR